jgi:hypothetical protein
MAAVELSAPHLVNEYVKAAIKAGPRIRLEAYGINEDTPCDWGGWRYLKDVSKNECRESSQTHFTLLKEWPSQSRSDTGQLKRMLEKNIVHIKKENIKPFVDFMKFCMYDPRSSQCRGFIGEIKLIVKKAFIDDLEVSPEEQEEKLDEWYEALKQTREQTSLQRERANDALVKANANVMDVRYDVIYELVNRVFSDRVNEKNFYESYVVLMIIVGCRFNEILNPKVSFRPIIPEIDMEGMGQGSELYHDKRIIQIGQSKGKPATQEVKSTHYRVWDEQACMYKQDISDYAWRKPLTMGIKAKVWLAKWREVQVLANAMTQGKLFTKDSPESTPDGIAAMFGKGVTEATKSLFPHQCKQTEDKKLLFGSHFCRKLWVALALEEATNSNYLKKCNLSPQLYQAMILGHRTDGEKPDLKSQLHYSSLVRIIREGEVSGPIDHHAVMHTPRVSPEIKDADELLVKQCAALDQKKENLQVEDEVVDLGPKVGKVKRRRVVTKRKKSDAELPLIEEEKKEKEEEEPPPPKVKKPRAPRKKKVMPVLPPAPGDPGFVMVDQVDDDEPDLK